MSDASGSEHLPPRRPKAGARADLRTLALLVESVSAGSITEGAARSGMSLSMASARLAQLERRVGVRLLDRGRRGVVATAAGEAVVVRARQLLLAADDLESELAAHGRGLHETLRLVTNTAAGDAVTEALAAVLTQLPGMALTLSEMSSAAAVDHVERDLADLAVVSAVPVETTCESLRLWDDPLVVVGPGTAARSGLRIDEVLADPIVGLVRGSPLQDLLDQRARAVGLEPTYRVRLPTLAAVCAVATTGAGRAVVPRSSARRHGVPGGAVSRLVEPWAARHASVVARDLGALSGGAARLLRLLRTVEP